MVNRLVNFSANPIYFVFQQGDACMKLVDGKRVQILLQQQGERIVGSFRNIVFHIHRDNVDPFAAPVNKGLWLWK
jgi:hypothetical protein